MSSIYIFYPIKFHQKYNQELKNQGYIKINSYSPKGGVEFIEGDTAFCKCDTILPIKERPFPQWDYEGDPFCGIFIIKAKIGEIIIAKNNNKTCKISISDWHPEYYIPKVDIDSRAMIIFLIVFMIINFTVSSILSLILIYQYFAPKVKSFYP